MESSEAQVECSECGEICLLETFQYHECTLQDGGTQDSVAFLSQLESEPEPEAEDINEDNLVEKLAEAVQARNALWDHTLPLKQRSKEIREKMWREVFNQINGLVPLHQLEKKWKNLKDTFLKHLRSYKPSGSGVNDKKKWKHFDSLFFLAEKNGPKRTKGNISESELMSPISESSSTKDSTPSTSAKRKRDNETNELLLGILKEPAPQIPPVQQLSPVLLTIQSVLDRLPTRVRMKAEIEMLNKVYSLYDLYPTETE